MYSQEELTEIIKGVIENNPDSDKFFATSDGNVFVKDAENSALLHSKNSGLPLKAYDRNAVEIVESEIINNEEVDSESNAGGQGGSDDDPSLLSQNNPSNPQPPTE